MTNEELDAIEARVTAWYPSHEQLARSIAQTARDALALVAEVRRLREALESVDGCSVCLGCGDRAREALRGGRSRRSWRSSARCTRGASDWADEEAHRAFGTPNPIIATALRAAYDRGRAEEREEIASRVRIFLDAAIDHRNAKPTDDFLNGVTFAAGRIAEVIRARGAR